MLSPTFNLLYEYDFKNFKIMHYDLYRIKKKELKNLGIFSENEKTIKIIEWANLIKTPLSNKLEIHLNYTNIENERKIKVCRNRQVEKFLNELQIKKISGDASFREFYRLKKGKKLQL